MLGKTPVTKQSWKEQAMGFSWPLLQTWAPDHTGGAFFIAPLQAVWIMLFPLFWIIPSGLNSKQ